MVPVQHDRSHGSFQKLLKARRYLQKRACVGLLWGGHKLILLLVWGREGEYPEKGLRALVLGFLITGMEKRMGFFLLQKHSGWPHQPIIPKKAACPSLPPHSRVLQQNGQGFSRPLFPFLHKQRFCWVIDIFISTQLLIRAVNAIWLMFPELQGKKSHFLVIHHLRNRVHLGKALVLL